MAVVVLVAHDPDAVFNVGCVTRVPNRLPLGSRVYHVGVYVPLYQILVTTVVSAVVPIPGIQDERE